ncbi:MAG: lysophospholipid acyltransferase family protein [Anaerolineales bacterium]
MTLFTTPILATLFRWLAKAALFFSGWHVEGALPLLPKFVIVGAPHTSNWDFLLMLALGLVLRANLHFMGKAELFRSPLGAFFRWCGGIPVERSKSNGLVEQMIQRFQTTDQFILAIAPEGTRERVTQWKSGFYHIAQGAGVPIVAVFVDAKRKVIGMGKEFPLSGQAEEDVENIRLFYGQFQGICKK